MIQIKITDSAYQEKPVTLNKTTFYIRATFNTSDNYWYLDISDNNDNDILNGIKILPNQFLTRKYLTIDALLGTGALYCYNNESTSEIIGKDNFGTDKQYQLLYWTASEVAQYDAAIG